MLSPGPSVRHRGRRDRKGKRKRLHPPPQDIREGVARAYEVMKEVSSPFFLFIDLTFNSNIFLFRVSVTRQSKFVKWLHWNTIKRVL